MSDWHAVATLDELRSRKKKAVDVAGTPVALFWINDQVYALHDTCIHEQRSLSKGALLFGKVICPGHQWKFDPATGEPDGQEGCQPTFDVEVDDAGTVHVSLERARAEA